MTPQREKYLAKCSKRELVLRHWIELQNVNIKAYKADFKKNPTKARRLLQTMKYELVVYRHELARLKGMDRVVVPRKAYIGAWGDKGGLCKCGKHITDVHNYCPWCGRRILWEKVIRCVQ